MQITIRNQRILRWLGFTPVGPTSVVSMSVRTWIDALTARQTNGATRTKR